MEIKLKRAQWSDCRELHDIQRRSFASLLEKYQDFDTSPAAETLERIRQRFLQDITEYYLICLGDTAVGMMRVCNYKDRCRLSPIGILPEYQGRGFAQQAMKLAEKAYPAARKWELDTIAQEEKLCHLYGKLGYRHTGKTVRIKEGMDIVFYEKEV